MIPASNDKPAVGWIGLGDQGTPIAQAIADNGYPLHVWARRPESLKALDGYEFVPHATIAEMAAVSDVVGLCLRGDSDNVLLASEGGLLTAMRRGTVLVNHGTGLPQAARHLADLASPYGIAVVDAPLAGGRAASYARQLTTMVGGDSEVVQRLTPIFQTFSKSVIRIGEAGAGQYAKLFNNVLMMMNHKSALDVLRLVDRLDLPIQAVLQALLSGSASSFALEAVGPSITTDNVHHLLPLELIDVGLFSGAVTSLGDSARPVIERATAGAQGLEALTALILG